MLVSISLPLNDMVGGGPCTKLPRLIMLELPPSAFVDGLRPDPGAGTLGDPRPLLVGKGRALEEVGCPPDKRCPLGGPWPLEFGGARPVDMDGGGPLAEVGDVIPVDIDRVVEFVGECPPLFLRGVGVLSTSKLRVLCW